MGGIEIDDGGLTPGEYGSDDICTSILAREDRRYLCAVIGAMAQEPVAFFDQACSSLHDGLSAFPPAPGHVIESFLKILSIVFQRVPPEILDKKGVFLSRLITRVLLFSSLTEDAAVSGFKCLSLLLIVRGRVSRGRAIWSDVGSLYGLLLSFVTDPRPKVRRQSHLCLRDALQNFQGTPPLLTPASKGVTNLFERSLPLAGGSNANASEGPKEAQEALYVLDALKECLSHLSIKYKTDVLNRCKTLLELHQPLVTKRITDSINVLCQSPSTDVAPELLLDPLSSLALSVSTNETSVDTIGELASISDKVVSSIFKSTMQRLLKVTEEASKEESSKDSNSMRTQLFGLAVSLLPGLNAKEVDVLYSEIKAALQDDEGLIQKKAYRVLSIILRDCDWFLSSKREELLEHMTEVLPSCHFSAKGQRLYCLYLLVLHVSKTNKKTRNSAYDILGKIGRACEDEEKGGKRENLQQFFDKVAGGLAGETPHMNRAAAAMKDLARLANELGLARLANEFSDLVPLIQRKNKETTKADLSLLKVSVAKSERENDGFVDPLPDIHPDQHRASNDKRLFDGPPANASRTTAGGYVCGSQPPAGEHGSFPAGGGIAVDRSTFNGNNISNRGGDITFNINNRECDALAFNINVLSMSVIEDSTIGFSKFGNNYGGFKG